MKIALKNRILLSDVPGDLKQTLIRRLQFPNPKYLEAERLGRYTHGIPKVLKFYAETAKGGLIIPRGYMRQLLLLCRERGQAYTIADNRRVLPDAGFAFSGTLMPFQTDAVTKMLSRDFGTLSAPTGSGKTVMALYMAAERNQPTLVAVHTRDLAYQWLDRIEAFLGIPPAEAGLIGDGKMRIGGKITVGLVQSLYKKAKDAAGHVGFLIVDECHRTPSRTFTETVTAFDSKYMLGLSATPYRRDKLSKLIFWHLGDVHHEIERSLLVDKGVILEPEIIVRETAFKPYFDPVQDYSRMIAELTADDDRNRLIAADIAKEAETGRGICLALSDRKKHCETLQSLLRFRHHVEAELLTGDVGTAQRQEILARLNNGMIKVVIATGQLMGEGFDCKGLSTLFITTPIRFSGRLMQYMGRILRPSPDKGRARVYDYVDVHVGPLKAAAAARQRVYLRGA